MCDTDWLTSFPNLTITANIPFPKTTSDHQPLFLTLHDAQNWGTKPFRLINAWLSSPSFKPLVISEWNKLEGKPLHKKFQLLKTPIKQWNVTSFGNIDSKLKAIARELAYIDALGDVRELEIAELNRYNNLKIEESK